VLDGTGVDVPRWTALLTLTGCHYVTVSDLEVRNSPQDGIQILRDATHIRAERLHVHDCGGSGLVMMGLGRPAYVYVRDGEYHDNEFCGVHAVSVLGGYVVIEGNRVHHNRGTANYDAIQSGIGDPGMGSHHVVIRNNDVYENRDVAAGGGDAIDLGGRNDHMTHYLVEGNRVWGSNGLVKFSRTTRYAIMRRNQITGGAFIDLYAPPYPQCSIIHNTLYQTYHGVEMGVGEIGGAVTPPLDINWGGLQIRNNIFAFGANYVLNIFSKGFNRNPDSIGLAGNLYRLAEGAPGRWYLDDWWSVSPEPGHVLTEALIEALFVNAAARDFTPASGSPAIDAAPPLTRTTADGEGKTVPVADARYFVDGWDGLFVADSIQIGANTPVRLAAVDYERNTLTLTQPLAWTAGDPVSLPWWGQAPDIGAVERRP